jgi:hypothetical protein
VRAWGGSDKGVPLSQEPDAQGGKAEFEKWVAEVEVEGRDEFEVEVEGGDKFAAGRGNDIEEQEAKVEVEVARGNEVDV